jgi:uncharacterized protein
MKDFIEYLVKNIVNDPNQVDIRTKEGTQGTLIEIRVAPEDIGKVVGKGGKVIRSLRTLCISIGVRIGLRVQLEIVQENS